MPEADRPPEWDGARYQREKHDFIEKRALLRPVTLHLAVIFTLTGLAGWLGSRALLAFGIHNMPGRYLASFLFAYIVFALCVRVWADFMRRERDTNSGWVDNLDVPGADAEGCAVAIAVFVVACVAAGVFSLLGGVPLLLEVAFEVVFAGVVVRRLGRREQVGDWSGKLVRSTWLPASLIALALVFVAGWLQHEAPQARTLAEAIRVVSRDGR